MEIDLNKGLDINISEERFWQIYLKLLTINFPNLTDREIDVLAFILSDDINKPSFRRGNHTRVADKLKMSIAELSIMKKRLIEKGFLKHSEEGIIPHEKLNTFRKYIRGERNKGAFPVTIKLPYVL